MQVIKMGYKVNGLNIAQVYALSIGDAYDFFKNLSMRRVDDASSIIFQEIVNRLKYRLPTQGGTALKSRN